MAQFLQLVQRVRQETGTAGTGPVTVEAQKGQLAQLVTWTAQAYLDVCNKWDDWDFLWSENAALVAEGVSDIAPIAGARLVNEDAVYLYGGILPPEGQKLEHIGYDLYRRNKNSDSLPGVPAFFTTLPNGKLRLLPTPDADYSLEYEYWREPTPLTENTSLPEFSSLYDDCIVWRACWYWAVFNEAQAEAGAFNYSYEQAMLRLEARYLPASEKYHARSQGVDIVVRAE